ncbi:MAG: dihydroxyacetone kinase subunit DhaL [Actinobacteria bacterium]|nr:dihydroxyacetone kinase subunit DhaL [Actinomycetota bacterium]
MEINAADFKKILLDIAATIDSNVDYLTELDAEIGDGDHGVNMNKGFKKIRENLLASNTGDIGEMLIISGKVLLNEIGGAMGPLYGGGFVKAGILLKGKGKIDKTDIYNMFKAILDSMNSIAPAKIGDKTLVDTIEPFINEYGGLMDSNDLLNTFGKALIRAKEGMESTKDMISKVGRSSRLLERSKGHIDVGAASSYLILESFYNSLKSLKK